MGLAGSDVDKRGTFPPAPDASRDACDHAVMAQSVAAAKDAILSLLAERDPDKTICPSEAARSLDPDDFRSLMPLVREAAGELVADGRIEVTQKGEVVDLASARGPIRLRLSSGG